MAIACPHIRIQRFLGPELAQDLWRHAVARRNDFRPGSIVTRTGTMVEPSVFTALNLGDLGAFREVMAQRLSAMAPDLMARLAVPPFEVADVEVLMGAYGHGHFYKPHSDVLVGDMAHGKPVRVITACYYFHSQPRKFQGGALRLHGFAPVPGTGGFIDIEPEHDTLVVFPSFARHEVMPISCPGIEFPDWRFMLAMRLRRAPVC